MVDQHLHGRFANPCKLDSELGRQRKDDESTRRIRRSRSQSLTNHLPLQSTPLLISYRRAKDNRSVCNTHMLYHTIDRYTSQLNPPHTQDGDRRGFDPCLESTPDLQTDTFRVCVSIPKAMLDNLSNDR
jgi:hypothetical protein